MNLFVADPGWHWWIVFYFFLGGIAAGAYFTASLIDLFGREQDRELARIGYLVAFPLVAVCGLLLILDLSRPERFWHMLLKSEVAKAAIEEGWPLSPASWPTMLSAPAFKYWSPMSVGSWALLLFGFCSSLSFLGGLRRGGRLARRLRHGRFGRVIQLCGSALGFFVAAYTGALLTATNQPLWSDSVWIASLFLTSAASTGIATLLLLALMRSSVAHESRARLERADLWVVGLELIVFALFVLSLGGILGSVIRVPAGRLLLGTAVVAVVLPLSLQLWLRLRPAQTGERRRVIAASCLGLLGGFMLRYAILATPPQLLDEIPADAGRASEIGTPPASLMRLGPEDGRAAGEPGADPHNRVGTVRPPSKVFRED